MAISQDWDIAKMKFNLSYRRLAILCEVALLWRTVATPISSRWEQAATLVSAPDVLLSAWPYCWVANFTPELCCGDYVSANACQFDPFLWRREECCSVGHAVLDPYALTVPPPIAFPSFGPGWERGHPADHPDQGIWELLMEGASDDAFVALLGSEVLHDSRLMIYKGDRAELPSYGFEHLTNADRRLVRRIVDVGGNYGAIAITTAKLFPEALIVVIEANPLLCRYILWNVRVAGLQARIWPICAALGGTAEPLVMVVCNEPWRGAALTGCIRAAMSTFEAGPDWRRSAAVAGEEGGNQQLIEVPVVTMEEVLARLRWPSIDLLKMDCEGCEWTTLLGSPQPRWRASIMVGELHFGCSRSTCWKRGIANVSHKCTPLARTFGSASELAALLSLPECLPFHPRIGVSLETLQG